MWAIVSVDENADYGYGGEMYTSYSAERGIGPFATEEEARTHWMGMPTRPYEQTFMIKLDAP